MRCVRVRSRRPRGSCGSMGPGSGVWSGPGSSGMAGHRSAPMKKMWRTTRCIASSSVSGEGDTPGSSTAKASGASSRGSRCGRPAVSPPGAERGLSPVRYRRPTTSRIGTVAQFASRGGGGGARLRDAVRAYRPPNSEHPSGEELVVLLQLIAEGHGIPEIAERLGVARSTIYRWINLVKKIGGQAEAMRQIGGSRLDTR